MEYRNAKYNSFGSIDCEIKHPDYGWIPFTAIDGGDATCQSVFDMASSGNPVPYVAPSPSDVLQAERAQMQCTRRQARIVLGPDTCAAIDALADDPETPWALRQTLLYAQVWERAAPEIDEIGWALGYDAEQTDALFRAAATI